MWNSRHRINLRNSARGGGAQGRPNQFIRRRIGKRSLRDEVYNLGPDKQYNNVERERKNDAVEIPKQRANCTEVCVSNVALTLPARAEKVISRRRSREDTRVRADPGRIDGACTK